MKISEPQRKWIVGKYCREWKFIDQNNVETFPWIRVKWLFQNYLKWAIFILFLWLMDRRNIKLDFLSYLIKYIYLLWEIVYLKEYRNIELLWRTWRTQKHQGFWKKKDAPIGVLGQPTFSKIRMESEAIGIPK